MTPRKAARKADMGVLFKFILDSPGCLVSEISRATGMSHSEVSRYIHWKRMEWRPIKYIFEVRKNNPPLYRRFLHDGEYTIRGGVAGMLINTSKREMFDRYCLSRGYNLSVNTAGECFVTPIIQLDTGDCGDEMKRTLRMYALSTNDQKKTSEARACQMKLL